MSIACRGCNRAFLHCQPVESEKGVSRRIRVTRTGWNLELVLPGLVTLDETTLAYRIGGQDVRLLNEHACYMVSGKGCRRNSLADVLCSMGKNVSIELGEESFMRLWKKCVDSWR
jgi:hypothetical protein